LSSAIYVSCFIRWNLQCKTKTCSRDCRVSC
jgi:hypothetical protein